MMNEIKKRSVLSKSKTEKNVKTSMTKVLLWMIIVSSCIFMVNAEPDNRSLLNDIEFQQKKKHLEGVCGPKAATALLDYAAFHDSVIRGTGPKRDLIAVAVEAGLADRLTGIISLFWLAFLSKHAFQIGQYEKLPRFEAAYDYMFVNWTRYNPDVEKEETHVAPLRFTYKGQRGYKGPRYYDLNDIDIDLYHPLYMINNKAMIDGLFGKSNLRVFPGNDLRPYPLESHVFASSNRGGIHSLYNNTFHRDYLLKELELPEENAFRCAYHFLFQINDRVKKLIDVDMQRLSVNTQFPRMHNFNIGVGIRVGDLSFHPDFDAKNTTLEKYEPFFQCAANMERSYQSLSLSRSQSSFPTISIQHQQQPVKSTWYIMAESLKLRQLIAEKYNNNNNSHDHSQKSNSALQELSVSRVDKKLIVDTKTLYFHGDCNKRNYHGTCDKESLDMAIIAAVAQLTLFSMCNVHIISPLSGFPRTAAILAKPPHRIYLMTDKHRQNIDDVCRLDSGNHTSFEFLSKVGCGI